MFPVLYIKLYSKAGQVALVKGSRMVAGISFGGRMADFVEASQQGRNRQPLNDHRKADNAKGDGDNLVPVGNFGRQSQRQGQRQNRMC